MKKRESKLWQKIKKHCPQNLHLIRVESNTINGIPDINGCLLVKNFGWNLNRIRLDIQSYLNGKYSWINKRVNMVVQ